MNVIKKITVFLIISTFVFITGCSKETPAASSETETAQSATERVTERATETEKKTETETERAPETTVVPETEPAPETIPEPTPEPEPIPEPDPIPEPMPEPVPVPETDPPSAAVEFVGYTSKGFPIEIRDGRTYIGGLLIVNKTYSLPSSYDPGGMTPECASAFYTMCAAASADGIGFYSISDYRSYALQTWLYQTYVDRDGKEAADTFSARPGHSEHQTGLAIDVNTTTQAFAYSAEGQWLAAHCWEYGFIIRYPQGKEWATGFVYEPWHVRYVGTWLSIPLRDSGLTLEEYLGIDSVYN